MYELSFVELESELSAELPTRNLMCRRRHRRHHSCNNGGNGGNSGTSAYANNGSGANSASQSITVAPVQTAVATGDGDASNRITGGISVEQSMTQQNTPVNLALG